MLSTPSTSPARGAPQSASPWGWTNACASEPRDRLDQKSRHNWRKPVPGRTRRRSLSGPILDPQPRHVGEVSFIVRHNDQVERKRVCSDQAVVACPPKRQSGVSHSRLVVEIENGNFLDE